MCLLFPAVCASSLLNTRKFLPVLSRSKCMCGTHIPATGRINVLQHFLLPQNMAKHRQSGAPLKQRVTLRGLMPVCWMSWNNVFFWLPKIKIYLKKASELKSFQKILSLSLGISPHKTHPQDLSDVNWNTSQRNTTENEVVNCWAHTIYHILKKQIRSPFVHIDVVLEPSSP